MDGDRHKYKIFNKCVKSISVNLVNSNVTNTKTVNVNDHLEVKKENDCINLPPKKIITLLVSGSEVTNVEVLK